MKNLSVGDTYEEAIGNGYIATFEVVGINPLESKRVSLVKESDKPKVEKVEKVETEKPVVKTAPKKEVKPTPKKKK